MRRLGVSVKSSAICAAIDDSSRPTSANPREYGGTLRSVSKFPATCGQRNTGNDDGGSPKSPTCRTWSFTIMDTPLSTMIATSGEGTALEIRGNRT